MSDKIGSLQSQESQKGTTSLTQKNTRTTPGESNGYQEGHENNSNSLKNDMHQPAIGSTGTNHFDQNADNNLMNFNQIHQQQNTLLKNQTANPILEGLPHSGSDNILGQG